MAANAPNENEQFLDPAVLENLGNMQIRAQSLVVGILSGMHRSPHRGGAIEFAEYVEYTPGQEIRHIDWKVYAKSDKYYVKQFQDETNLRVYLLVDASGSMNYAGEDTALTKLRYASFLSATLAYMFLRQGDAVGMLTAHESDRRYLPASAKSRHLDDVFHILETLPGDGYASLTDALKEVAERAKPRSLVIVFSDMLEADEEALSLLAVLRKRRYEVAVFHAVDRSELDFPFEGQTQFVGLEGEEDLLADPDDLRNEYKRLIESHIQTVEKAAADHQIDYVRFFTDEPIESVVLKFIRGRV